MIWLSIIVGFSLLFVLFIAILKNYSKQVSSSLIILLVLYDWIFIYLGYSLSSNMVFALKSFGEILIILLISLFFSRLSYRQSRIDHFDLTFFMLIGIPFACSILAGGSSSSLAMSGYKIFFFPYIVAYLLFKCKFLNINYNILNYITLIVSSGAILQYVLYNGDLTSLWFYNSFNRFDENPVDVGYFNYLKGDSLRATSCFVTSIDLSLICALLMIYHISQILFKCGRLAIQLPLLLYAFAGLYLSQTRVGFAIVAIGVFSLFLFKFKYKINPKRLYLIPIVVIIATLVLLIKGAVDDESALGRLIQYGTFFNDFSLMGAGIGDQDAIFKYDSFILCSLKMMGVSALLYFAMYFKLLNSTIREFVCRGSQSKLAPFIIASANSLIYAFMFQHLAGSSALTLIIFFMFDFLSNPDK